MSIKEDFFGKKVLVVGDVMLDKHIYGSVSRISPEAPVPVLKPKKETYNPGGAANVASNLSSLGAKVYISGVIGNDEPGNILLKEFQKLKVDTSCIIHTNKPTIQKIRGMTNQHLFRIDYEDSSSISQEDEVKLLNSIKLKIKEIDAVVLSDYAKGTLTESLVKSIIQLSKENNKLITADCKAINVGFYKNINLLKPNKKEAIEMTLTENIEEAGKKLIEKLNSDVVITRGNEGVSAFSKEGKVYHIPTKAKEVYDVAGAGDTFLATLTLALISGNNLKKSTELANEAAGIVISKPGVTTISIDELKNNLSNNIKIVPKEWGEEQWLVNNEKYCGKKMLIKKDYYCSYHMHKIKEETFYISQGELEVIHNGKYIKVGAGQTLHIKPLEYHSFRALKDTVFFEFSTKHMDEDNYRLTKSSFGNHKKWRSEIESAKD